MPPLPIALPMFVQWVKGREVLRLFAYSANTHLFTETKSGLSTLRATIVNDGSDTVIAIESVPVLWFTLGVLQVRKFSAKGGTSALGDTNPRLEFWRGPRRLGCIIKTGELRVANCAETDVTAGNDRFCFYGGGVLRVTLGDDGLRIGGGIKANN